jgi:hypothetical protein
MGGIQASSLSRPATIFLPLDYFSLFICGVFPTAKNEISGAFQRCFASLDRTGRFDFFAFHYSFTAGNLEPRYTFQGG